MKKAIVLLSGGLDSATALGIALSEGRACLAVSFDYGQRHRRELEAATRVVNHYGKAHGMLGHRRITLEGLNFISSALTSEIPVPHGSTDAIPVTYVPARNSILLAVTTGIAEAADADEVWTGFNAVDYSGYPDCRPGYVAAMQAALALGTKRGVEGNPIRIETPIIGHTKIEVVRTALQLGVPLEHTWSCYEGGAKPCGQCDSCVIRAAAFAALGRKDPAL